MSELSPRCPITNSTRVRLIEQVSTKRLAGCYQKIIECTSEEFYGTHPLISKYRSLETGYEFFYPFDIEGRESLYRKLEQNDWYYMDNKWEYAEALNFVLPEDKVLEIGCGTGAFLKILHARQRHSPVGLELNEEAVQKARLSGLSVYKELVQHYVNDKESFFDMVCCFQVLEHIANVRDFVQSALKALKPNGRLVVCVPDNDSFIKYDKTNALNFPPHHMGLWNAKSLTNMGIHFGLEVEAIRIEPLQEYHIAWYTRVMLQQVAGEFLYFRFLQNSFVEKWIKKFVTIKRTAIKGHSILAVFRKK